MELLPKPTPEICKTEQVLQCQNCILHFCTKLSQSFSSNNKVPPYLLITARLNSSDLTQFYVDYHFFCFYFFLSFLHLCLAIRKEILDKVTGHSGIPVEGAVQPQDEAKNLCEGNSKRSLKGL